MMGMSGTTAGQAGHELNFAVGYYMLRVSCHRNFRVVVTPTSTTPVTSTRSASRLKRVGHSSHAVDTLAFAGIALHAKPQG